MRPLGAGDALSAFAFCSDSTYTMLVVHREHRDRPFAERDAGVLEVLARSLASRTGVRLATRRHHGRHDLSPRQRDTLDRLLEGDGEKQVADRLGISVATAHEYVKALYRYYGVQSRGELLAYHLRRRPSQKGSASRPGSVAP
jgi:DNA-binding CsgD family transcriptional regulator